MQRIQTIVEGIASGESAGIDNSDLVSLLDAITKQPKRGGFPAVRGAVVCLVKHRRGLN